MSDDDFIAQFEDCSFPFDQWHHRAHVKLAYLYLVRYGFETAGEKLRNGIRAYNSVNKIPDLPTSGYHETITLFWLRIIQTTVQEYGQLVTADEFSTSTRNSARRRTIDSSTRRVYSCRLKPSANLSNRILRTSPKRRIPENLPKPAQDVSTKLPALAVEGTRILD